MATIRRIAAVALSTFVLTALSTVPAHAQTTQVVAPEAFIATSSARALDLNLLGNRVTVGVTSALIDSSAKAQATGAGVLLIGGTIANAAVSGLPGTTALEDPPPACVLNLPLLNLLNAAVACGDAKAILGDAGPSASGQGGVAAIDLHLSLLQPLIDQLVALVGNTIGAVVDPLLALLGNLLNPLLGSLNLNVNNLVDELLAGVQRATGVLRITLGTSSSDSLTTADKVTAQGVAAGVQVDVLPGLALSGAPLLSIVVGSAKAAVDITRPAPGASVTTATAVPSFDPAIVTVRLGLPLLGNITEIPVRLGEPITLLAGTPLESTIALGAGRTVTNPDGSVAAVADGVSLQLLKGVAGGIGLDLAHAEAAGGGKSAQVTTVQLQEPVPVQEQLARTGATPWMPLTGFGLLLAALVTRRLLAGGR
jgi:hypothetical protein